MRRQVDWQARGHHVRTPHHHDRTHVEAETTERSPIFDDLRHEMDEILGEIGEALEANAEEFVAAYVHKGGQ